MLTCESWWGIQIILRHDDDLMPTQKRLQAPAISFVCAGTGAKTILAVILTDVGFSNPQSQWTGAPPVRSACPAPATPAAATPPRVVERNLAEIEATRLGGRREPMAGATDYESRPEEARGMSDGPTRTSDPAVPALMLPAPNAAL